MRAYSFILDHIPQDIESFIDIGCGKGEVGFLAGVDRRFNIKRMVGLDAFGPYIEFCKDHSIYNETHHFELRDISDNPLPFNEAEFDVTLLSQVIEHLSPEDGTSLLAELDRITAKRIIVVTDNFWTEGIHTETGNPFQEHHSRWTVDKFKDLGYRVFGIGAFRYQIPFNSVARMMEIAVRRLPSLSRNVLAIKDRT